VRAFGELETQWAQTPAEAHAILDELIALHQAGWAARGESGAFAGERFTGFHRELIERLVPQGRAVLFRVARADGAAVGCLYGFLEGERLLFYQGGLARFEDNKLRAGLVCHVLCMQACLERGVADYDFLAPASRYKEELSTRTDHLVWAHVERRRLRARLHTHLRRARIRLRAA
jgi:CelD/BcsL family acetyltransferase involved in cellulose biosynthesis